MLLKKPGYWFIILFSFHPSLFSQGSWERIHLPSTVWFRSVYFTDSLFGWVAGDSGIILHTTDGGKNWMPQTTNLKYEIADIFFPDRQNGWASAFNYSDPPYGTRILKTKDGGNTWIVTDYPGEDVFITCINFSDSLHGWIGGKPHIIAGTDDGGVIWKEAEMDTSTLAFFPVLNILFYNKKYGWACGGMFDIAGVVWRTTDGGKKWSAIDPAFAPADEVHALHAFDSLHVLGAGGDPDFGYGVGMIRTHDGGVTWQYKECSIPGFAVDLDFRTKTEAWAPLGIRKQLIYSFDSGDSWKAMATPDSVEIFDMAFPDSLHGFAVGKHGALLKYKPSHGEGIGELKRNHDNYLLFQNNPNPFSEKTTIRYFCPGSDASGNIPDPDTRLFLKIFDLTGNEREKIELKDITAGEHEITISRNNLKPGIYFGVLEILTRHSQGFSRSVKIVVESF